MQTQSSPRQDGIHPAQFNNIGSNNNSMCEAPRPPLSYQRAHQDYYGIYSSRDIREGDDRGFVAPSMRTFEEVYEGIPSEIHLSNLFQEVLARKGYEERPRQDTLPKSYDIIIRPVRYPGLVLNFDVERDFNYELARILQTLNYAPIIEEAYEIAGNFTLYAHIDDELFDCRIDLRFLYMSLSHPEIKIRLHQYTKAEKVMVEEILSKLEREHHQAAKDKLEREKQSTEMMNDESHRQTQVQSTFRTTAPPDQSESLLAPAMQNSDIDMPLDSNDGDDEELRVPNSGYIGLPHFTLHEARSQPPPHYKMPQIPAEKPKGYANKRVNFKKILLKSEYAVEQVDKKPPTRKLDVE